MAKTAFNAKDGIISGATVTSNGNLIFTDVSSAVEGMRSDGTSVNMLSHSTTNLILGDYTANHNTYIRSNALFVSPSNGVEHEVYHAGNQPTTLDVPVGTTALDAGKFWITSYNASPSIDDAPEPFSDVINLSKDTNHGIQLAASYSTDDSALYYRNRSTDPAAPKGAGLQKWNKMFHEGYAPTPAQVGSVNLTGDTMTGALLSTKFETTTKDYSETIGGWFFNNWLTDTNQGIAQYADQDAIRFKAVNDSNIFATDVRDMDMLVWHSNDYQKVYHSGDPQLTAVAPTANDHIANKKYVDDIAGTKLDNTGIIHFDRSDDNQGIEFNNVLSVAGNMFDTGASINFHESFDGGGGLIDYLTFTKTDNTADTAPKGGFDFMHRINDGVGQPVSEASLLRIGPTTIRAALPIEATKELGVGAGWRSNTQLRVLADNTKSWALTSQSNGTGTSNGGIQITTVHDMAPALSIVQGGTENARIRSNGDFYSTGTFNIGANPITTTQFRVVSELNYAAHIQNTNTNPNRHGLLVQVASNDQNAKALHVVGSSNGSDILESFYVTNNGKVFSKNIGINQLSSDDWALSTTAKSGVLVATEASGIGFNNVHADDNGKAFAARGTTNTNENIQMYANGNVLSTGRVLFNGSNNTGFSTMKVTGTANNEVAAEFTALAATSGAVHLRADGDAFYLNGLDETNTQKFFVRGKGQAYFASSLGIGIAPTDTEKVSIQSTNATLLKLDSTTTATGVHGLYVKMDSASSDRYAITAQTDDAGTPEFTVSSAGNVTAVDAEFTGNTGITVPTGTEAERGSNTQGKIRFNTDLSEFEGFDGAEWSGLGGGGKPAPEIVTSDTTMETGKYYLADLTSVSNITLTIPAGTNPGDIVYVGDYNGLCSLAKAITLTSTDNIHSSADDFYVTSANCQLTLMYIDATIGWKIVDGIGEGSDVLPQLEVDILPFGSYDVGNNLSLPSGMTWDDFETVEVGLAIDGNTSIYNTISVPRESLANRYNMNLRIWSANLVSLYHMAVNITGDSTFNIERDSRSATTARIAYIKGYTKYQPILQTGRQETSILSAPVDITGSGSVVTLTESMTGFDDLIIETAMNEGGSNVMMESRTYRVAALLGHNLYFELGNQYTSGSNQNSRAWIERGTVTTTGFTARCDTFGVQTGTILAIYGVKY